MKAEERKTAMSHDEMQDYWETLCSFTGEDIPNEVNQLMAKIRYPRFLYKYRAVNNNNLDALRSNKHSSLKPAVMMIRSTPFYILMWIRSVRNLIATIVPLKH